VQVESLYHHAPAPVPGKTFHHSHEHQHHQHEHEHEHGHLHSHEHTHSHSQEPKKHETETSEETGHSSAGNHGSADHDATHEHSGPIRNLPEIRRLLAETPEAIQYIPAAVRRTAVAVFTELAHAEAHVHGITSIHQVHFHEVGAVDSIVDIVLTCWALHHLGVVSLSCSALPLGKGHVSTAHGILPVPAPATLYLLRDVVELTPGPPGAYGELVTPTAAALLRVLLVNSDGKQQSLPRSSRLRRVGVGAGTKEFTTHPNIVRLMLLETTEVKKTSDSKHGAR